MPSTEGQSNNLLFALDSVCLLFTQFHLVYLQNSYVTWLLFPFLCTTANQRTDCSTTRQMWTSKREQGFHLTVPRLLPQVPACISLIVCSNTSMVGTGENCGKSLKSNCSWYLLFQTAVKLWATQFIYKKNKTKLYQIVKINFLPFSGLAQKLVSMKSI